MFQSSLDTAGDDYTAVINRLLTFNSATTRQGVEVSITGDSVNEGEETFQARLSFAGPVANGIQLGPNQATVEISDDDGTLYDSTYNIHTPDTLVCREFSRFS